MVVEEELVAVDYDDISPFPLALFHEWFVLDKLVVIA
jgi:hypothetical protein